MKRISEITDKKSLLSLLWQFIKFGIVGVSNTLLSSGICYLFIFINEDLIYAGQIAGFLISVLNAYYWNNRYVFKQDKGAPPKRWREHAKALFRVYVAYGFGLLLGLGLTWVMRNKMGVSEWLIPVILLFICTPINFLTNKLWAFKGRSKKQHDEHQAS